ncbi:MAG: hypothetical protein WCO67_02405 [Betaproteobacteria bacterium]
MNLCKRLVAAGIASAFSLCAVPAQAALIGLTPNEPVIEFGASGIISYDAVTGIVTVSGVPATLFRNDPFIFGEVIGTGVDDEKFVTVKFRVDSAGNFVGGVDGPDLVVRGAVDVDFDGVIDYEGDLIQAEVAQFGFVNGVAGGDDFFDLRFGPATGALEPLYAGQNIAMRIVSEASTEFPTPFGGSFTSSFAALAKGSVGSTAPVAVAACKIDVEAYCSVDGGPAKSACRIAATKSPHHWAYEDRCDAKGNNYRRHTYGMHGLPVPGWASKYKATNVKFTYVVKNTGAVPITGLYMDDSFDVPVTGFPATLAPGASFTVTRTEGLRETLENVVLVQGHNESVSCADTDTVVIKDKLRDRKRHDDDRYKDKGRRDD